jgi:transposase
MKQRWIIVRNRESKYKELKTLKIQLEKEEKALVKTVAAINNKRFKSKEAIENRIENLKKRHPCFTFRLAIIARSKKSRGARSQSRRCVLRFSRHESRIKKLENKKGKFIIATNRLDSSLTAEKIIDLYCGRNRNIEGCFKLIKDAAYRLNEIFLKRVDRIEALMSVMALSLFVNNLGQLLLRRSLKANDQTIPNQKGQPTRNPTLKWAFQTMDKVIKLTLKVVDDVFEQFIGIGKAQRQIIACFGPYARALYGFP